MPTLTLKVLEVIQETSDTKSIKLDLTGTNFSYKPGNFVMLKLDVQDPRGCTRAFSVASSPTENFILLTTKISPSPFKQKFDTLKPGDMVTVNGPFGVFLLDETKPAVLLGGGIGITPFRCYIKYATDKKLNLKITLLYSNRVPEGIVYKREFNNWQKQNQNFKIINTVTDLQLSKEKEDWKGLIGRIDETMIRKYVLDINSAIFYICGPPAMVEAMVNLLKQVNIDSARIKIERFAGY